MKTKEFLELLKMHQNKELRFEYQTGKLVGASYHITEVKNITIESVDCGAGTDSWKETVIQLWESPSEIGKREFMSSFKALGILNKVDKMKTMERNAEVKFEYSNPEFHTAQLFVDTLAWDDMTLTLKLSIQKTDCKAKETCGVPEPEIVTAQNGCAPGSGCC